MQSYAQNFEDVLLNRAFGGKETGFYIDVGAYHPRNYSVTHWFHKIGWQGITVEPIPWLHARFVQRRPKAINLNCALGETPGQAVLHVLPETGLSSLDPAALDVARKEGIVPQELTVKVETLADICRRHVTGPIDFLKIDVEGFERQVIAGGDWVSFRPKIVVLEATHPNSPIPSHESWEPLMLSKGYLFAWFDGLNRFYVATEEAPLAKVLALPPNVFDNFQIMPVKPDEKARPPAPWRRWLFGRKKP